MKEVSNHLSVVYNRSSEFSSEETATISKDAFDNVMKLKKVSGVYASKLTKLDNGNYVVEILILKNEYKGKDHNSAKEKAIQILAGISSTISQA